MRTLRADPQTIATERDRVELARPPPLERRAARHAQIDLACDEARHALLGAEPAHRHRHVRRLFSKARYGTGQELARHGLRAADDDALRERSVRVHRRRELDELHRDTADTCPERSETKLSSSTGEERPARVVDERLQAPPQHARVQMELPRGPFEGARARHVDLRGEDAERPRMLHQIARKSLQSIHAEDA